MVKETSKGLLGITAAGAAEGALITSLWVPGTLPASALVGGLAGGTVAFGGELARRKLKSNETPSQMTVAETLAAPNTLVDVSVETTSMTKRTDVPEEASPPIVKTNAEQVASVSIADLPNTLASIHARTLEHAFPTWQTTLQEKTTASAVSTSAYEHRPQRTG